MELPFLKKVFIKKDTSDVFPYNTQLFVNGDVSIDLKKPITIFCGENGAGKSTLLKAVAESIGFSEIGGSSDHHTSQESNIFDKNIRLSWLPKVNAGFYFRADKLSDYSSYVDGIANDGFKSVYDGLGGKSLEAQSHGQAVFGLISKYTSSNTRRIVILDEPESSLSIASQIKLVEIIYELSQKSTQFIIASHSPVIMLLPHAELINVDKNGLTNIETKETENYLLMRQFIKEGTSFFDYLNKEKH